MYQQALLATPAPLRTAAAATVTGEVQDAAAPQSGTPAAAAAAPPTPLEQRQWQRLAQRSVRLAVTAFKDATARYTAACTQGTGVATQLTNSYLNQRYLPDLRLPAVLQQVQGLQQAAAAKLSRQQLQHLNELQEVYRQLEAALQDMHAALSDVNSQPSQPSINWQRSMPVFHTLSLPECASLLHQVVDMHQQDLQAKKAVIDYLQTTPDQGIESLCSNTVGSSRSTSRSSNAECGKSNKQQPDNGVESTRKQMTAAITTWMVRPCIEDESIAQLLQVLTDEMTGF